MSNIFENAKFGKLYKTREGKMMIYLRKMPDKNDFHEVLDSDINIAHFHSNGQYIEFYPLPCDIISEWDKPIDEKKLDKLDETRLSELALEHAESMDIACRYEEAAVEGYKAGYRKALEQHKLDIEKACDWFSEHIIDYVCYNEMDGWDVYHGEMHKDFRKAMEGKE